MIPYMYSTICVMCAEEPGSDTLKHQLEYGRTIPVVRRVPCTSSTARTKFSTRTDIPH